MKVVAAAAAAAAAAVVLMLVVVMPLVVVMVMVVIVMAARRRHEGTDGGGAVGLWSCHVRQARSCALRSRGQVTWQVTWAGHVGRSRWAGHVARSRGVKLLDHLACGDVTRRKSADLVGSGGI